MRYSVLVFLMSLAAAAVLTPLAKRLAHRLGAIDLALSSRKVHKSPIPRLGGIAIVGAFYASLFALFVFRTRAEHSFHADWRASVGLFAGGAVIAALGVYDDVRGARPKLKFLVQFAVAGLVYALGFRIQELANPFGSPIPLGVAALPLTLLWVVGVINAINLIDGLDGLAGGVAFISVLTMLVAALLHGQAAMAIVTAALAGAVLGFLWYNTNPASIFMGDTGSMFLGFVLATTAISNNRTSDTAVAVIAPIVALGLPITDTLLAMARRALRGVPMFQADREHIHHRLLALGFSQRKAVVVLYGTSIFLGVTAVVLSTASGGVAAATLAALALLGGIMLRRLGYMSVERTVEVLEARRRNLELRRRIRDIGESLRRAAQVDDVWGAVKSVMPAVGADCVRLQVVLERSVGNTPVSLSEGFERATPGAFRSRHCLQGERPDRGVLELGWSSGPSAVTRDTEIAIEQLCEYIYEAVCRVDVEAPGRKVPLASAAGPARNDRIARER